MYVSGPFVNLLQHTMYVSGSFISLLQHIMYVSGPFINLLQHIMCVSGSFVNLLQRIMYISSSFVNQLQRIMCVSRFFVNLLQHTIGGPDQHRAKLTPLTWARKGRHFLNQRPRPLATQATAALGGPAQLQPRATSPQP